MPTLTLGEMKLAPLGLMAAPVKRLGYRQLHQILFLLYQVVQLGIRTTPDKMYSRPSSFHEFPPLNIGALNVLQILLQNVIN